MKVQIDMDVQELSKLNKDLDTFLGDNGVEDSITSSEILEILEKNILPNVMPFIGHD
jgi:hypothetical protein